MRMRKRPLNHHKMVERNMFQFARARVDINDLIKVVQEFDDYGNHRLVCNEYCSEWKTYRGVSVLTIPGLGKWGGVSDYYQGELPAVFQIINAFDL